jgi:hypothetical protein
MTRTAAACAVAVALAAALAPAADSRTVVLFNGKDTTGWTVHAHGKTTASQWAVGTAAIDAKDPAKLTVTPAKDPATAELVNTGRGGNLASDQKFGDCVIDLEFFYPKGSNSGVYVMGEYEVQIYDTHELKPQKDYQKLGGLYLTAAPKVDVSKPYGNWQRFVIDFRAPHFDAAGRKTENAKFVKVEHNGTVIHENVEVKGPTPSGLTGKESATGPIMFQGDHGPVAFRNIRVTPKGE